MSSITMDDETYKGLEKSIDSAIRSLVDINRDTPAHMRDINVWAMMSEPTIRQLVATVTTIAAQALFDHMLSPKREEEEIPSVYDLMQKLGLHGFLTLSNVHTAIVMQERTMKYRVRHEIRLSNGFIFDDITDDLYETLSSLWNRTQRWYELYHPEYLQNEEVPANI